jgi:predicted outer membrane repeat protein
MLLYNKECVIVNSVYSNNTAQGSGGAIRVDTGNFTISNSALSTNSALGGQYALGGAVYVVEECNSTFISTIFSHNAAIGGSGGALNTKSDTYITGCKFENNTAAYGGAIRYGLTGIVTVNITQYIKNVATTAGGAMHCSFAATPAKLSDTVRFYSNTAFCCYAKTSAVHTTTANSTCVDIAYRETPISECCPVGVYSDGTNCQLCTKELTCAGIVGANTSTVILPEGTWRASTTSTRTYSCWNSDACTGGVAAASTDDYCTKGYKGPCKYTTLTVCMRQSLCD